MKYENDTYHINVLEETYLKDEFVSNLLEYQPDKFIAYVEFTGKFKLFDRRSKQIVMMIRNPCGKFKCGDLEKLPYYDDIKFPYVLMRDINGFNLINMSNFKIIRFLTGENN